MSKLLSKEQRNRLAEARYQFAKGNLSFENYHFKLSAVYNS